MRSKWLVSVGFLALVVVTACGPSVGDACNEEGKIENQCSNDAICGKTKEGPLKCLQQCVDSAQCPSGEECAGVSKTNIKGCRPK